MMVPITEAMIVPVRITPVMVLIIVVIIVRVMIVLSMIAIVMITSSLGPVEMAGTAPAKSSSPKSMCGRLTAQTEPDYTRKKRERQN